MPPKTKEQKEAEKGEKLEGKVEGGDTRTVATGQEPVVETKCPTCGRDKVNS